MVEDLQKVIEIENGVYWLGMRSDSQLEVNIYLRVFQGHEKTIHLIIDPGGSIVLPTLLERVKSVIGNPRKIQLAFISHQDPDVGMNAIYLQKLNPNLSVICSEDSWRLLYFSGLKLSNFQPTTKFRHMRGRLSTGQVMRFVPTPYCHFRGSYMLYDEESRILFSSDLFGGLSYSPQLFATPESWDGIRIFHQIYMPAGEALRMTIDKIRKLQPAPKMIAPQHGAIIRGDLIDEFLEKMSELPVGLDLASTMELDKEIYLEGLNEILETISQNAGEDIVENALQHFSSDGTFPSLLTIKNGKAVDVKDSIPGDLVKSFKTLIDVLAQDQPDHVKDIIKDAVLQVSQNLPLFEVVVQAEAVTSELLIDDGQRN